MSNKDLTYWITLSHISGLSAKTINSIIKTFYKDLNSNIIDFFNSDEKTWFNIYKLNDDQIQKIKQAKEKINANVTIVERLLDSGYEIIPILSNDYPISLKKYLKYNSPPLLYIKGNKNLLNEACIGIVGSRNASEIALQFTDQITKKFVQQNKVIVSGYAKGVDRQSLESALKYNGKSIIVLPQGILRFNFKDIYHGLIEQRILILSVFHPLISWKVELAMARNKIIYGLSEKVYVAETSGEGGTWAGAIEGLKNNSKIYIRYIDDNQNHPHNLLISKGAIPVDLSGEQISLSHTNKQNDYSSVLTQKPFYPIKQELEFIEKLREFLANQNKSSSEIENIIHKISEVLITYGINVKSENLNSTALKDSLLYNSINYIKENSEAYQTNNTFIINTIKEILSKKPMNLNEISNEIEKHLKLKISHQKVSKLLQNIDSIEKKKIKNKMYFYIKSNLFDN